MRRPQQMSAHPEEILDDAMHRGEALDVGGRLEALHLAFALSRLSFTRQGVGTRRVSSSYTRLVCSRLQRSTAGAPAR